MLVLQIELVDRQQFPCPRIAAIDGDIVQVNRNNGQVLFGSSSQHLERFARRGIVVDVSRSVRRPTQSPETAEPCPSRRQ